VKSREEVLRRLKKLRARYLRRHLRLSQDRRPRNCSYNHEVQASPARSRFSDPGDDVSGPGDERPVQPARSSSLVVLQDDPSVRVCLYGCEDPATWAGDLCYTDEKAESCGWFKPEKDPAEAEREFDAMLADDKYVYDHYPDVAALQWVLEDRVHRHRPGLLERLWRRLFRPKSVSKPKLLPPVADLGSDALDVDQDVLENPDFDPSLTGLFR